MGLLDNFIDDRIKKSRSKAEEPSLLGALKDPQFLQDMKRGVLDSVNRGAVASTIGGPVDLATMLMRPLGYNVEKPVGGSEWVGDKMQQLGLLGDYRNPVAEALASVAVPGAMTKAGQGLFKAEQAAIQNANIAGPLSGGKFASQRGVFGGINAKTADKAKLAQAEQMLNKGVDPAQVWKETGWGRGPDGKWRFEIPDNKASLRDYQLTPMEAYKDATFRAAVGDGDHTRALGMRDYAGMSKKQLNDEFARTGGEIVDAALSGDKDLAKKLNADRQGLSDLLSRMGSRQYGPASSWLKHGDLGDAYPDVYKMHTRISPDDVGSAKAHYSRGNEFQGEQIVLGKKPMFDDEKSTMLHELQHAIQQREGFARGGSPEAMADLVGEARYKLQENTDRLRRIQNEYADKAIGMVRDYPNDDFVRSAVQKWEAKLGKVSDSNPFGVSPEDAVRFELSEQAGIVPRIADENDKLRKLAGIDQHEAYKRLGGEAEARLVQSRMNLTPEQRLSQYPWNPDYFKQQTGVGLDDLIHRFDGGEAKSVGFTYPKDAALETARKNGVKMLGLPENNTALDRAKALGFEDGHYHGTRADTNTLKAVRPNYGVQAIEQATGLRPVFTTDSGAQASEYALRKNGGKNASVYPLMVRRDGEVGYDFGNQEWIKNKQYLDPETTSGTLGGSEWLDTMPLYHWAKSEGAPTIRMEGVHDGAGISHGFPSTVTAVVDPTKLRSRFAAFDPARVNENDLLAGAMPFGLLIDPENRAKLGMQ